MSKPSSDSLLQAFSAASGKFYRLDRLQAVREAGRFFLDVLRHIKTEEA